jgi:hypothetical protein
MKIAFTIFFIMILTSVISASKPLLNISLIVADNAGGIQPLNFGIDSSATDGIDTGLGEAPLPPLPPSGVFDARFNLPNGKEASLRDYRQGIKTFIGQKIYNIQFQPGTGTSISISWYLPSGIKGRLQDVITGSQIDTQMAGIGIYQVANPGIYNKLQMTLTFDGLLPVEAETGAVTSFNLEQNYPNPFNPSTQIKYSLLSNSSVKVKIFNALGESVKEIANEVQESGVHTINFNASGLSSGVYFYTIEANPTDGSKSFRATKKMILMK